ncbi:hypothetical protein SAMN03159494_03580 [Achromobacter sp. NFACC18-2]|nr:hypothetical protein SAMN03159494_03580 [Achromobacter sp. NFACC18-2]
MLLPAGESVILVLEEGAGDYANCSAILDAETAKVLAKGWHFNTDRGIKLVPDVDGKILVPANTLRLDYCDPKLDIAQRDGYLYDLINHTDVFTEPVVVDRVVLLTFEGCPYHVQREIVGKAAQFYQRSFVGSDTLDKYTTEERAEATADSRDSEVDEDDYNILNNPDLAYLRRHSFRRGI